MGMRYYTYVATNAAKINNPVAVSHALKPFDLSRLMLVITKTGDKPTLTLADDTRLEDGDWPSAVRDAELPDRDAFEHDYLATEAEVQLYEERGQQGLSDLLLALAPYLDEPLIIQAASFDSIGVFYRAAEWTVRPGATAIEHKEIVALDNARARD